MHTDQNPDPESIRSPVRIIAIILALDVHTLPLVRQDLPEAPLIPQP